MEWKFRPAIRAVILKGNKILLAKMWKIWAVPWGWIDHSETFEQVLARETLEELWVGWRLYKVIFLQDYLNWLKDWGEWTHFLEYFFTIKNNEDFKSVVYTYKEASHAFELQDLKWFSLDEIPKNMMPQAFVPVLKEYLKNKDNFTTKYISWIEV